MDFEDWLETYNAFPRPKLTDREKQIAEAAWFASKKVTEERFEDVRKLTNKEHWNQMLGNQAYSG